MAITFAYTGDRTPFSFQNMQAVAYDATNDRWVAVGDGGALILSIDGGLTWTAQTVPVYPTAALVAVAYGGGMWVVSGLATQNRMWSSPDGTTWTNRTNGFGTSLARAIAYGNGTFVAVGADGKSATSTNGTSWTQRTSVGAVSLAGVAFGAGVFVATGAGRIFRSTNDGETWTEQTNPHGTMTTRGVSYIDGKFVIAANNGRILSSTDGITWDLHETESVVEWWTVNKTNVGFIAVGASATWDAGATLDTMQTQTAFAGTAVLRDIKLGDGNVLVPAGRGIWQGPDGDPIVPPPPPTSHIDTPVSITVISAAQTIDTATRVQVSAPGTINTSVRVNVISASTVAGLNGAGGWPAAPDGKWSGVVALDNANIPQLTGEIRVSRADDEAATASFSFLPVAPVEPMALIRRPVRITFAQAGGLNAQLMFTGVVDVAEIDIATGVIACRCTDQLQEVISNTPVAWIDENVGGRWSEVVSGAPVDAWEYLQARIKSVPKSIALDLFQRPVVVPWRDLPRPATVRQADYIDGTLALELPSSVEMRTRVTARLQYRYTRLRARGAMARYAQPFSFFASYSPTLGLTLRYWLTTAMVEAATERLPAWERVGRVVIEHPAAQTYFVNPPNFGGYTITPDLALQLVLGFDARYQTRWTQTVTESYSVTLTLPDLETEIGAAVGEEIGANLSADRPPDRWASDYTVQPALTPPQMGDVSTPWQPDGFDAAARDEALRTLMDQAWVRLWAANRTGRVKFALPLRPDFWLDMWITLDVAQVTAAGKLSALTHVLDLQSGEAVTAVEVAVGLPGNSAAAQPSPSLPTLPAEVSETPLDAYSVEIGTFVGGEAESVPFDAETMIGFATNRQRTGVEGENTFEYYPMQLSMRAPTIDAPDLDPLELNAEQTIETQIPRDLLEIHP